MPIPISKSEASTTTQERTTSSNVFAIVQHISTHISRGRIHEAVTRAQLVDTSHRRFVVDLLSISLEEGCSRLENADRVLLLLTKIASSANVFARNRTINSNHIVPSQTDVPDVYTLRGNTPVQVRVVKRGKENSAEVFNEDLITWAHLSHASILPIYAAFLDGTDGPVSLVSPQTTKGNIVEYATTLSQATRIPLISDMIDGLCYLHKLAVVHGRLSPQYVSISNDGRALIICPSLSTEMEDFEIRYSAPELLKEEEEDPQPTQGADMWSLGCIAYEILSGKIPFWQIRHERKVLLAILHGKRPTRPNERECEGNEIGQEIWHPMSFCWGFEPDDRPSCSDMQVIFASPRPHVKHPLSTLAVNPEAFAHKGHPVFDPELMKSVLGEIVGCDSSKPTTAPFNPSQKLQDLLLNNSLVKGGILAEVTKGLLSDDIQTLVNILDLIIEESREHLKIHDLNAVLILLEEIIISTHIIPQRYKTDRITYDPTPIAEGDFGKVYQGRSRGLDVCINVITRPGDVSNIIEFLALGTHISHPNVVPLYGMFFEDVNQTPQVCVVSPYMKNGLLRDYACRISQIHRLPLISDIINGLVYLQELNIRPFEVRGDSILITGDGRALITCFGTGEMLIAPASKGAIDTSGLYALRFYAPERARNNEASYEADSVWSFGCLLYEVLSRTPPYYQYTEESEILSALCKEEPLKRPTASTDAIDEIDDEFWGLITKCRAAKHRDRPTAKEIRDQIAKMILHHERRVKQSTAQPEVLESRLRLPIDLDCTKQIFDQIQLLHLQTSFSNLITHSISNVAVAAKGLELKDRQNLVDFLDLALKDLLVDNSRERRYFLKLLSDISLFEHPFPQRHKLKGIKYWSSCIAQGSYGTVHRGLYDPDLCIKVIKRVEPEIVKLCIRELIVWAHSLHLNILPFYGVFVNERKQICLVSPFMQNGNLRDYTFQLPNPDDRVPLLHDVIKGLRYMHDQGIIHADLKGVNVVISHQGRALITDFGSSRITTITAQPRATIASLAYTLRFVAPEMIQGSDMRPTKACDIWSFGCLCYEALSRKVPYFQYRLDPFVTGALFRGEPPKRPITIEQTSDDDDDFNQSHREDNDLDEIDDLAWHLITSCCSPEPKDRPNALEVLNMIVDLGIPDTRSRIQPILDAQILKFRVDVDVDFGHAGKLLDEIQSSLVSKMTGDA